MRTTRDLKRAWTGLKNGKLKITLGLLIILFVYIVVPIGTPDDLVTTVPLYMWLGDSFWYLLGFALLLWGAYEKRWI